MNNSDEKLLSGSVTEKIVNSESRATRISNYLNSPNYLELIKTFDLEKRGEVIGLTTQYFILHPDGKDADDFVHQLQGINFSGILGNARVTQLLVDSIAKKLGLNNIETDNAKTQIFDYYIENHELNGVYYHGFNGAFESAILTNGLTTNERFWNWKDLDEIRKIGEINGKGMLLGWANINSEGKISFSEVAKNSYRYALASPEWFAQFVSEGFHIPSNPIQKNAYYRGDYEQARINIEQLCIKMQSSKLEDIQNKKVSPNISDAEKQKILDFFEKYWALFRGANSSPCLALISRNILNEQPEQYKKKVKKVYGDYTSFAKKTDSTSVIDAISIIEGGNSLHIDGQIKINIPSNKIEIVHLPEYEQVYQ